MSIKSEMATKAFESLRRVGFWWSANEPHLPMPIAGSCSLNPEQRQALVVYLKGGHKLVRYMGCSHCRLPGDAGCDKGVWLEGSADVTDGVWIWPEALPHYVEVHRVDLPHQFVEHALGVGAD